MKPNLKEFCKRLGIDEDKIVKSRLFTFTIDEQLAAVTQDGWAIQFIENPSEEVQLAAVKKRWYCNLLY